MTDYFPAVWVDIITTSIHTYQPLIPSGTLFKSYTLQVIQNTLVLVQSISWFLKGNQASAWNRGEGCPATVREVEIIEMLISFFLMIIISIFLTVPGQPSPRFHMEAWLPFRNREMDYLTALYTKTVLWALLYSVRYIYTAWKTYEGTYNPTVSVWRHLSALISSGRVKTWSLDFLKISGLMYLFDESQLLLC